MDDVHTYEIELRGRVEERGWSMDGPLQAEVVRTDERSILLRARTDQSGLIGLLRHLHGRGAVLLSIRCAD